MVAHKVKVTVDQEAELVRRAAARRVTVSRLLVESALADRAPAAPADAVTQEAMAELFALSRLLGRVSVNVNQLARAANATGEVSAAAPAALTAVERTCARIDAWVAGR